MHVMELTSDDGARASAPQSSAPTSAKLVDPTTALPLRCVSSSPELRELLWSECSPQLPDTPHRRLLRSSSSSSDEASAISISDKFPINRRRSPAGAASCAIGFGLFGRNKVTSPLDVDRRTTRPE